MEGTSQENAEVRADNSGNPNIAGTTEQQRSDSYEAQFKSLGEIKKKRKE